MKPSLRPEKKNIPEHFQKETRYVHSINQIKQEDFILQLNFGTVRFGASHRIRPTLYRSGWRMFVVHERFKNTDRSVSIERSVVKQEESF